MATSAATRVVPTFRARRRRPRAVVDEGVRAWLGDDVTTWIGQAARATSTGVVGLTVEQQRPSGRGKGQ